MHDHTMCAMCRNIGQNTGGKYNNNNNSRITNLRSQFIYTYVLNELESTHTHTHTRNMCVMRQTLRLTISPECITTNAQFCSRIGQIVCDGSSGNPYNASQINVCTVVAVVAVARHRTQQIVLPRVTESKKENKNRKKNKKQKIKRIM